MGKVTSPKTEKLSTRPPVVVIMGHIDHGKSTLLDYIRKSNIVSGEAGGITQHLGAYEVVHTTTEGKTGTITFLDTPGHEAFGGIRTRGAHVADIAILVVSAEDGVKPQTLEALRVILKEKIPYIVAINKIDKPGANVERTKVNLAENEIYVEGYGGDVSVVGISALKGTGISELLDTVMLVAELQGLTGDHGVAATGTIIEANLDTKKGISSMLIIRNGTLKTGMYVVAENTYSPVRILLDFLGKPLKEATFSSPVKIIGWNSFPTVGSTFVAVDSKRDAEDLLEQQLEKQRENQKKEKVLEQSFDGKIIIPIILKADVIGSIEGIKHELAKIKHEKVAIRIIDESIGNINESDIKASLHNPDTSIIAFNVKPDSKAKSIIERNPVNLHIFNVIYNLVEYIQNVATSKIPKEYIEETTGRAKVLALFSKNKDRQILGGKVQEGSIFIGAEVKILRRDIEIGRGRIKELQQQKQKAEEVREGYEFGALIESKIEIAQGDKVECFKVVEKTEKK